MSLAMGKGFKYWILLFAIAGFTFAVYSQGPTQGPPEPQTSASQSNGNGRGPCGRLPNPDNSGKGPGIPPPVGLCLPINDYLLPLFLSGILFGGYMMWRIEKRVEDS
jgi:hypothetical protein